MVISRRFVDEMIAHVQSLAPEEGCGMLATRHGQVEALHRVTNSHHSPVFYVMDPQEQLRAVLAIEDGGMQVGAIYHSHPSSPAVPSPRDIELAQWPDALYIIISLADRAAPDLRTWRIEHGEATEEQLNIIA